MMNNRQALCIVDTSLFLEQLANRLDQWSEQSKAGGWSTHQVQANVETANECRRQAAILRQALEPQD